MSRLIHIGQPPKAPECTSCGYTVGFSTCFDSFPPGAKFTILLDAPSGDDILYGRPLSGKRGDFLEWRLLKPLGLTKADVAVSHVIRCKPGFKAYPTGKWRHAAEEHCRVFDDCAGRDRSTPGLKSWNQDMFVITLDPFMLLQTPAPTLFILAHLEKAMRFVARGRRPIVCMGSVPMNHIAPHLHGGVKRWSGHWSDL